MSNSATAGDGLPEGWSESARATYAQLSKQNPGLPLHGSGLAVLFEACALVAAADAMQKQVDTDGLMVRGSQGQPVAHPLLAEIRQSRVQAMTAIRSLGLDRGQSSASAAGTALANRRHRASVPGVRAA